MYGNPVLVIRSGYLRTLRRRMLILTSSRASSFDLLELHLDLGHARFEHLLVDHALDPLGRLLGDIQHVQHVLFDLT